MDYVLYIHIFNFDFFPCGSLYHKKRLKQKTGTLFALWFSAFIMVLDIWSAFQKKIVEWINVILEWEWMRKTILSVSRLNKFKIQNSAYLKCNSLYLLARHADSFLISLILKNSILNSTSPIPPASSSSATYPALWDFLLPPFPLQFC